MGGTKGWRHGRHAVAIAALLFYAFLSSWLPSSFAAPVGVPHQQSVVIDLADDIDDDVVTVAGDLAAPGAFLPPLYGWPLAPAAGLQRAPRIFAPLVSRARDPPSLNV